MKGAFKPSWTAFIVLTTVDQMVSILTVDSVGRFWPHRVGRKSPILGRAKMTTPESDKNNQWLIATLWDHPRASYLYPMCFY